ncbi:glucose PTS transporter subunit IIA [Xylocopilactobacillus apis]|uniref:PTS system sucrose-specific EIIBCA component n=1 Tax=Xylocopilactobacillus apis TaxID=2932183 RepID=A0AAU9CNF6_9LACO|nr:glucose PTS transporter subunit IIA [Xylocopilactobacillus apis]BDR55469.1 PTS beta-glucoside transporter subunit EIIBCA [Xylocopilactobacillus apis]
MVKEESLNILSLVGGTRNVNSLVHCATRLRFSLKDNAKADKSKIEELPYVLSVVISGGQFQVVIGPKVADYYDVIISQLNSTTEDKHEKFSLLKVISGAFTPLIPILAGAGMVKALLTVLTTLNWLSDKSTLYAVWSAAGNSIFYFLPIFLGMTLAKQFKADMFVGGALGAALLEPNFTALIGKKGLNLFNISLTPVDYATTVFPIFLIAIVYAGLNKLLKKIIPQQLQLFLNPMICLLILVPAAVIVFGPFGTVIGNAVSAFIAWLFSVSHVLAGLVMGATYPFLTMLGLHWGFTPITLQNLHQFGGDVLEGTAVATVYAQIGIAIGAYLRSKKNSKMRGIAGPTVLTGLLAGVTEPILYGIIMRSKRLLAIVAISGGVGGAINGLFHVQMTSYVFHNLFSLIFMSYKPMPFMILGVSVSLILGAVLTYFFGVTKDDADYFPVNKSVEKVPEPSDKEIKVYAPIVGQAISLKDVDDEVFASESVGQGIAIIPAKGEVKSPFNGQVITIFPTKHAIGLRSDTDVELLIHIGLNTVNLNGQGYNLMVEDGQKISQGDLLLTFDLEEIKKQGYSIQTPVIVTNYQDHSVEVIVEKDQSIDNSSQIMLVK